MCHYLYMYDRFDYLDKISSLRPSIHCPLLAISEQVGVLVTAGSAETTRSRARSRALELDDGIKAAGPGWALSTRRRVPLRGDRTAMARRAEVCEEP